MPLRLRDLTLKLKTKFTPPASPSTESPTLSFEAVGRQERQRERAQTVSTNGSTESVVSQENGATSPHARELTQALQKVGEERAQRRRSKFREEL